MYLQIHGRCRVQVYARIGASAVNHEAKRAISNTMTWMDELDRLCVPVFESVTVKENELADNSAASALDTLKTIITQVVHTH